MTSDFYVIVGHRAYPAETTCSAPDDEAAREVVECFSKGGTMALPNIEPDPVVYKPGEEVPDSVARHVIS